MSFVFGLLKEGVSLWRESRQAKHDMKMAGIKNRQRLLESEQDYNHEWEMKSLEVSGRGLKWFSFSMFSLPIIITVMSPEHGGAIFKNLELVPEWFIKTWVVINGGVWGIASLRDSGVSFKNLFAHHKK